MFSTLNRIGSTIQEAMTIPENAVIHYNKVKKVEHRKEYRKVIANAAKDECKLLKEVAELELPEAAKWDKLEKLYA